MGRQVRTLLVMGLLAQGALAAAQSLPPGERAVLRWAEQELSKGQRQHAVRGLLRALKRTPSELLAVRYAELAMPARVPADARERESGKVAAGKLLKLFDEAARAALAPRSALGLALAWALSLTGEHTSARELAVLHGLANDAHTTRTLRAMASLALLDERMNEAEATLQLARAFAPTDPDIASELGLLLLATGAPHRALPLLGERFAGDLSSLPARRDFAGALLAAGRAAEAYQLLWAAQEACAAEITCQLQLARTALEAGQFDDAAARAEQLLAVDASHVDGLFVLAEAHTQRARTADARATYERILRLLPSNLRAQSALNALAHDQTKR